MIATLAKVLHQRIDDIEEWEIEKFDRYFDAAAEIVEAQG